MDVKDEWLIKDPRPYVLWRRVSTKKQGNSGLGLEAQLNLATLFTGREPSRIFTDVYSGTKLRECVGLWEAIRYCKENNHLLIIAKTDRFRNVREALEVIDEVGSQNISFCDMPYVDRMILTIMFSVWEKHALMGRVNTRLSLAERKRQAQANGGWISKNGNWRTQLGHQKGFYKPTDETKAKIGASNHNNMIEWSEQSVGVEWVRRQVERGMPRAQIIEQFNICRESGADGFSTKTGKPLTKAILSKWISRMGLKSTI